MQEAFAAQTCYQLHGQGEPLVLIHGVGLDQHLWAAQAQVLGRHYQVLRYDLYGHGHSGPAPDPLALDDYVAQLDSLLTHLGIGRCAVAGFSLGSLVARGFAGAFPGRVSKLLIMSGVYRRDPRQRAAVQARLAQAEQQGPAAIIDAALERWFSPQFRAAHPGVIAAVRRRLEDNDAAGFIRAYRLFAGAGGDLDDALAAIRVPVLIMTGELDTGSTPLMARQMAAQLAHVELHILPGQRHMLPLEAADQVNTLIEAFLTRRNGQ